MTQKDPNAKRIKDWERSGWNYYSDPPDWLVNSAVDDNLDNPAGGVDVKKELYHGDDYVYLATNPISGESPLIFSQKKQQYYDVGVDGGVCPHCNQYIRHHDGDEYLTCHSCGWQKKGLLDRVREWLG